MNTPSPTLSGSLVVGLTCDVDAEKLKAFIAGFLVGKTFNAATRDALAEAIVKSGYFKINTTAKFIPGAAA